MTDKEKIQMFDDDSKAFKLLYNELKDVKNVIVKDVGQAVVGDIKQSPDYLLQLFTKADNKLKTYLHYTNEDLTENDESLRKQLQKVEDVGFKNQVVLPYEGMDQDTVEKRYAELRRAGVFAKDSINTKEEKQRAAQIEAKYRQEDKESLNPTPAVKEQQPKNITITSQDKTLTANVRSTKKVSDTDDERNIKGNKKKSFWK